MGLDYTAVDYHRDGLDEGYPVLDMEMRFTIGWTREIAGIRSKLFSLGQGSNDIPVRR